MMKVDLNKKEIEDSSFNIVTNLTKENTPDIDVLAIKNDILGKDYKLSIVFVDSKKSKELNTTYRKKEKPANVLSFNVSENIGEIFINLTTVKVESKEFSMKPNEYITFLLIHGMLHLKGYEHSSTMESEEDFFLNKFK